jgi:hypothetical protein
VDEPTQPAPVTLPAPVTSPTLDNFQLAALAREIAMNIRSLDSVLEDYKITPAGFADIANNDFFKRALDQLTIEWKSALSTGDRIKIEAQAALEDALPSLAARMKKQDETLGAAVEVGKLFAKLGGLGEEKINANAAEKFSIVINLGEDHKLTFEKDVAPALPIDVTPAVPTTKVKPNGTTRNKSLQKLPRRKT